MLKSTLYKAQQKAVKLFESRKQIALFMEPGTGKTITSFGLIDQKQRKRKRNFLVLVICPKNLISSWADELEEHYEDYIFNPNLDELSCIEDKTIFIVVNYEKVRSRIEYYQGWDWDFIILDESHRIKNRKAKTSKALWKLESDYKAILSGTPIAKDEIDLWSQYKWLNPKIWGNNFKIFAEKALREVDMGGFKKYKTHPKKIKSFMKKASKFTYKVSLDEIAEIPQKRDIPVYIELAGKQGKAYTELENNFLTEYDGKRSSIELGVTALIRLHQLVGGHLVLENGDSIRYENQPKLWWILDKLQDIGQEKALIFCKFTHEIELIAAALSKFKYTYEIMKGGMKDQEIKRVRKSFQSPNGCQILIGQIQTVKEGNNFQKSCRYAIFYSKSLSYIDIDQCKRRIYRNGQKRKVIYWHLLAKNTIDERIEKLINEKCNNAEVALLNLERKRLMAKKTKKLSDKPKVKKEKTTEKKKSAPKIERPEYGVEALAKAMDVDARTARLKLRQAGIEKDGRYYDFKNQKGVDQMVKQLSKKKKEAA